MPSPPPETVHTPLASVSSPMGDPAPTSVQVQPVGHACASFCSTYVCVGGPITSFWYTAVVVAEGVPEATPMPASTVVGMTIVCAVALISV